MFRIAMNAPIMAANTAIQVVKLARSAPAGELADALARAGGIRVVAERARADMASPLSKGIGGLAGSLRRRCLMCRNAQVSPRGNRRDHGHAGTQIDRRVVERDLHRNALHDLGEIAG